MFLIKKFIYKGTTDTYYIMIFEQTKIYFFTKYNIVK